MTALVGGTVERTFSAVGRYLTGLSGAKTHEAGRQYLGDFVEVVEFCGFCLLGEAHGRQEPTNAARSQGNSALRRDAAFTIVAERS
jgi:hypothetical protein